VELTSEHSELSPHSSLPTFSCGRGVNRHSVGPTRTDADQMASARNWSPPTELASRSSLTGSQKISGSPCAGSLSRANWSVDHFLPHSVAKFEQCIAVRR
jgi:hypothetical protein